MTSPDSDWTVALAGAAEVKRGAHPKPAATLTLSDADLVALARGAEPAQKLFQNGRLRVDGDVRVAQRLGFLKGLA